MERNEKLDDPRAINAKYLNQTVSKLHNKEFKFLPTQFIIDENYIRDPPKVQVSFQNINDNIDEKFLKSEISKIGQIRTLQIVRDPTGRHLGLARVQFMTAEDADRCIKHYTLKEFLMGKKLTVELDVRFEKIERLKLEAMMPTIQHKRPQEHTPSVQTPISHSFPTTPALPPIQTDIDKPINRPHCSLLERIAKMGLAQAGAYPPIPAPPPLHPIQNKKTMMQPRFQQNNIIPKQEKRHTNVEVPPPRPSFEEDERAWNPPIPSPVEEKLFLTDDQLDNTVIPFGSDKFLEELLHNVLGTARTKCVMHICYPRLDKSQAEFLRERDRKELEQRRQDQENVNKEREEKIMMQQIRHKNLEARFLGRQDFGNQNRNRGAIMVRHRTNGNDMIRGRLPISDELKRINRSSAFVDESRDLDARQRTFGSSDESQSSRRSRSRARSRFGSESRSVSAKSSDSSDSFSASRSPSSSGSSISSKDSSSRSSSLRSSRSTSRDKDRESPSFMIKVESSNASYKSPILVEDKEETAASALLDLKRQANALEKIDEPKLQITSKKRKTKLLGQENRVTKRPKIVENDLDVYVKPSQEKKPSKITTLEARSEKEIEAIENELIFTEEDIKYLEDIHNLYENEHSSSDRTRIPFGSRMVNEAHLMWKKNSIDSEKKSGNHPKWWNGCSRCCVVEVSDKGKVEETVYDDSQKALIKSHVIQAANSTRRDQRNDQRRMATLNSALDQSYLKQFTSNTLQLRAKNLRFSRSKIHKWGLFACEKIAEGEAVIEYVGEKIRPSLADHREKFAYPNLPTHDGSSYFFRVDSDVIDATLKGNKARFINHSCNPNCIAKVIKHENGTNSIVIYAKQAIDEDEEITYDYKFPREDDVDKIKCRCRAPNCKKYLN